MMNKYLFPISHTLVVMVTLLFWNNKKLGLFTMKLESLALHSRFIHLKRLPKAAMPVPTTNDVLYFDDTQHGADLV